MANYDTQKVPDLKALLTERGLPTTGKKSDLIERLTKDDEKKTETTAAAPAKIHPEDEIDWDDEEEASAEAAKTTAAPAEEPKATPAEVVNKAGGVGQPPNPQAVPNQQADIDPSTTDDLAVKPPTDEKDVAVAEAKKEEPAEDFTKGVAASNLEQEIEKRKKRAERFGLKVEEEDSNVKLLERAKKFGGAGPPKGLDEALPERERRKRGREDNEDGGRHKRRGGGGGGGGRSGGRQGRGNQDGGRRSDNRRDGGRSNGGGASWMSEADRQRAQSRRDRFAPKSTS
ncbi:unnamed protein product [Periconia digitata]|uniref:SAP domain-containing protein n=1 Tax=Periconia digitata TaxID=1303443 RepID=A0A9W4XPK5_9PLEO|nr:unnamed protein product [Periconia digitata]